MVRIWRKPGWLFRAFLAHSLLVAACQTPPPDEPTASPTRASEPAELTVTGSGVLCGPWWMGCGAVFAVEAPGWTLPEDWAPAADDTFFEIDPRPNDRTRIVGIREVGLDRIDPGEYRFAVIKTESPDNVTDGSFTASVHCWADVQVAPETRTVNVEVEFGAACTLDVTLDAPSPASSS